MTATIVLPEEPELVFRQLHHDLHAFASQTMDDDDALAFMTRLLGHESDFLAPVSIPPPQSSERQALQSESQVQVAGKIIDVSSTIQQEILKLSDEFQVSEARCLEVWFLASDAAKREWIERVDQLPVGMITTSIPAAARHFLLSEVEYKLNLVKELMRLRFDDRLEKKRRQFVISYTNKLLSEHLLSKLLSAVQETLPKLMAITPMAQSASYWHDLLADSVLFIVSSVRVLPKEIEQLADVMKTLCARLNTVVAKVSPHIVNLTSFAQLFESGSLAGTSPEGVVKQVSCMLRALTTMEIALVTVLLAKSELKMDRESGEWVSGNALSGATNASSVKNLHRVVFEDKWDQSSFQSVSMLAWAAFLSSQVDLSGAGVATISGGLLGRTGASGNVFAEVEAAPRVVKAALENKVFTTLAEVLLKYLPDGKHDPLLYSIFERQLQKLFVSYSSSLMVDVPTVADQVALSQMQRESEGDVASWEGDCLENIITFAVELCALDPSFPRTFWTSEELSSANENGDGNDDSNCHEFLLACRDAAFKNPACLPSYLTLVAAAADGAECAQLAFHHIKQNPAVLGWDHFFAVMGRYQKMLTDAERPAGYGIAPSVGGVGGPTDPSPFGNNRQSAPSQRFIRPKELEALESIQAVIQAVIRDQQLALIFFHNHDWSPIQSFVTFLQCRVPSSLKGELMKTLAIFAQVPEIAPFVWRQMDSLQILRTTPDVTVYGNQDISYELEHYESMARRYPATRGFVSLLHELFDHPHAWNMFEGDGRVAAIQYYFEFLLESVFLKFNLRKYDNDDEKWVLANGVLSIFKKILRQRGGSAAEGSFAYQLLQRLLSGGSMLEKLFYVLSTDGGVESLESTASNIHLEHSFFFCLEYAKKQTEATHGSLNFSTDSSKKRRKSSALGWSTDEHGGTTPRERTVQLALEILLLVLEKDTAFVNSGIQRQLSVRAQVEMLHTILFRHRLDFVNIVQFVKYTKSSYIAQLSVAILRIVSGRVSGNALVDLLVDCGATGDVMSGYMNRLLNVYDDEQETASSEPVVNSGFGYDGDDDTLGSVKFQTPKKRRRRSAGARSDADAVAPSIASTSIRSAILDLFLDNLEKPAPNLAHLLLGVLNGEAGSAGGYVNSGLEVLVTLLSTADFGFEHPDLAQRCYKVIHQLLVQEFSSPTVTHVLESPRYEFFATQLKLFESSYYLKRRRSAADVIGGLNMRGWFFKALAVYIHIALQKDPPHMKKVNRLMSHLLLTSDDQDTARQNRMLLLRLLHEASFDVYPPAVPANQQAVSLAEQVTVTVDQGYFKWLKIDVERFCEALQGADFDVNGSFASKRMRSSVHKSTSPGASGTEVLLQWAIDWNVYSERVAAESHALNSLRELVEVVVLDYLAFHSVDDVNEPLLWQGLDAISSAEVRVELIGGIVSAILHKLTDQPTGCAQLFEIVSKLLLLLFSELRHSFGSLVASESRRRQNLGYVELVYKAICCTATATGNPIAAQNARTLLYSCIVNVLSVVPTTSNSSSSVGPDSFFAATTSIGRTTAFASQVVDLVCRDASEGVDVLSMSLAVAALEAMASSSTSAPISKILRERGYLLHFINIFRKLCELDAGFDREMGESGSTRNAPQGVDATTIGTIYECFLSLFTRVAGDSEGAIALLEGGLVRSIAEMRNLPTHRPKMVFQSDGTGFGHTEAYRRAESIFARKWQPLVRLVSSLCASLPQNRTLAQQLLRLISQHRKLFTGSLKLTHHEKPTLSLLREVSHTTFILRYVTQFQDLCNQEISAVKWDKIAQAIVRIFLLYASEVVPPEDDDQMTDNDSVWWLRIVPQVPSEQRDDSILRMQGNGYVEEVLMDRIDAARDVVGLLRLSVFGEEKLYTSRMILCNAAALCANRMLKSVDASTRLLPGKSVLLAATAKKHSGAPTRFPPMDSVDRRTFAASVDPLWANAPAIDEFVVRLNVAVSALDASKTVLKALHAMEQEWSSTSSVSLSTQSRRQKNEADMAYLRNLLEYQTDSLTFVIENMTVVLMTHFGHFLAHAEPTVRGPIQQSLIKTLETMGGIEDNKFVHAIARRLRELASSKV